MFESNAFPRVLSCQQCQQAHAAHKTIPTGTLEKATSIWSFVCTSTELQACLGNYDYSLMDSIQINLFDIDEHFISSWSNCVVVAIQYLFFHSWQVLKLQ